jgi:hypothetical protein
MKGNLLRATACVALAILFAASPSGAEIAATSPSPDNKAAQDQPARGWATQNAPARDSANEEAPNDQSGKDRTGQKLNLAELDQLLAPIALYPDSLLGQILMAATYPLQVVEADRWLQSPTNARLKGGRLAAAVESQSWDPSVKSLVPFPRILRMMDLNLEWTERLGEAFLANQASVMDTIQRLRHRAQEAGTFRSNAEQVVASGTPIIMIEQPSPEIVNVPIYDPWTAYGVWPYPVYPPYYFPAAFDAPIGDLGFGWLSLPIIAPLWGWDRLDWSQNRIAINRASWAALDHVRPPAGDLWEHAPLHRRGVPYRDSTLQGRFPRTTGASLEAPLNARSYPGELPRREAGVQVVRPRIAPLNVQRAPVTHTQVTASPSVHPLPQAAAVPRATAPPAAAIHPPIVLGGH